jgi:hypothetical protein
MTRPAVPDDPALEARIQHALAPYRDRLTPAALAEARKVLTVLLTTHPVLAPLMDQVRQSAAPGSSGVAVKEGGDEREPAPAATLKRGKGRRG